MSPKDADTVELELRTKCKALYIPEWSSETGGLSAFLKVAIIFNYFYLFHMDADKKVRKSTLRD
jgi:hypothetical protein